MSDISKWAARRRAAIEKAERLREERRLGVPTAEMSFAPKINAAPKWPDGVARPSRASRQSTPVGLEGRRNESNGRKRRGRLIPTNDDFGGGLGDVLVKKKSLSRQTGRSRYGGTLQNSSVGVTQREQPLQSEKFRRVGEYTEHTARSFEYSRNVEDNRRRSQQKIEQPKVRSWEVNSQRSRSLQRDNVHNIEGKCNVVHEKQHQLDVFSGSRGLSRDGRVKVEVTQQFQQPQPRLCNNSKVFKNSNENENELFKNVTTSFQYKNNISTNNVYGIPAQQYKDMKGRDAHHFEAYQQIYPQERRFAKRYSVRADTQSPDVSTSSRAILTSQHQNDERMDYSHHNGTGGFFNARDSVATAAALRGRGGRGFGRRGRVRARGRGRGGRVSSGTYSSGGQVKIWGGEHRPSETSNYLVSDRSVGLIAQREQKNHIATGEKDERLVDSLSKTLRSFGVVSPKAQPIQKKVHKEFQPTTQNEYAANAASITSTGLIPAKSLQRAESFHENEYVASFSHSKHCGTNSVVNREKTGVKSNTLKKEKRDTKMKKLQYNKEREYASSSMHQNEYSRGQKKMRYGTDKIGMITEKDKKEMNMRDSANAKTKKKSSKQQNIPLEEKPPEPLTLIKCSICGRSFNSISHARHEKICRKSKKTKRKKFNIAAKRRSGLAEVNNINKNDLLQIQKRSKNEKLLNGKTKKWKQDSATLRQAMKASREYERAKTNGRAIPAPCMNEASYDQHAGLIKCPHCKRTFNETAAARHIPKCRMRKQKKIQRRSKK